MSNCEIRRNVKYVTFETNGNYGYMLDYSNRFSQDIAQKTAQSWIDDNCPGCEFYINNCVPNAIPKRPRGSNKYYPMVSAHDHPDIP